jgi:hypothetical protein
MASSARAPPSPEDIQKRTQQLQELLQETVRIAVSTGPRGFSRTVQAGRAMLTLGFEYAQRRELDAPEVLLRKIFEKLGATYIKLGQFIASSPSLFPAEYVTEFQKCLDQTESVPYEVIQGILQQEFKRPLTEVFSSIDPVPLASASVAQVHAAILAGSNKVSRELDSGPCAAQAWIHLAQLASAALHAGMPHMCGRECVASIGPGGICWSSRHGRNLGGHASCVLHAPPAATHASPPPSTLSCAPPPGLTLA